METLPFGINALQGNRCDGIDWSVLSQLTAFSLSSQAEFWPEPGKQEGRQVGTADMAFTISIQDTANNTIAINCWRK